MVTSIVLPMIHPWRRLRALTHITLVWADDGPSGLTDFSAGTITLRRGMTQAERRSTVLHECLHVERGPVPMGMAAGEELKVWKEQARILLPSIKEVGDALAWTQNDVTAAADELWVSEAVLRVRLKYLHVSERGWLARRLEDG